MDKTPIATQGQATYCPEDNKLRLYVGRVPRPEYDRLRAEGWTATPKQSEAGQGEFAATWTPARRDTALEFADMIEDEDAGPAERAADRAERFSVYREKRTNEAIGHADKHKAGPTAHGYQNQDRADRAAARHDRQADRAVDAWSKAEYWTRRTAGVISHALYRSGPGVRMKRIKELEAGLRRHDGTGDDWETHYRMRLLYENAMLESQGGRAAFVEMVPGGKLGNRLIVKVNKSNATGRVVSVECVGPRVEGWRYRVKSPKGAAYSLYQIKTERLPKSAYTAPTPESLAELEAYRNEGQTRRAAFKATQTPCPLVNPTDADAERLQAVWNDRARAAYSASMLRQYGKGFDADWKPSTVCRITQAQYSAASKGAYARAETRKVGTGCRLRETHYNAPHVAVVCEVRTTGADGMTFGAKRVIVLTDKPQKPLPSAVWQTDVAPVAAEQVPA